ncbi:MAG TPA: hypothetical protein VJQ59_02285 [Candidatus Sulfotelmatobacter sp.]|nr:hypothetical protein [Candidatus Sulfotelmatobacter sp.]
MTPEAKPPRRATTPFDVWKLQLRRDCERWDKIPAFNAMGDYVLKLLWERGLDPTVQAILECDREIRPN